MGVLCSWYDQTEIPLKFVITEKCTSHKFISVESYICTLVDGWFEALENDNQFPSVVKVVKPHVTLAKYLVLKSGTFTTIQNLTSATGSKDNPAIADQLESTTLLKMVAYCEHEKVDQVKLFPPPAATTRQ